MLDVFYIVILVVLALSLAAAIALLICTVMVDRKLVENGYSADEGKKGVFKGPLNKANDDEAENPDEKESE